MAKEANASTTKDKKKKKKKNPILNPKGLLASLSDRNKKMQGMLDELDAPITKPKDY